MALVGGKTSVLLENVDKLIKENLSQAQAKLVGQFVSRLYENISREDLTDRNDSDLYGAGLSLWHALDAHKPNTPTINVFNPDLSKHGWQSTHTIVEIITADVPFLVDSVRMTFNRLGLTAHWILFNRFHTNRNKKGHITSLSKKESEGEATETVFLIEIDRQTEHGLIDKLKAELASVISEVLLAVADWKPMVSRLNQVIDELKADPPPLDKDDIDEATLYLSWLADHQFTVMGYREYDLSAVSGDYILKQKPNTSLGLMKASESKKQRKLSDLPLSAREECLSPNCLILTKTCTQSRVHRPAYHDYVGVKKFDSEGKVIGEHRFIGLLSSEFYNSSAAVIPHISSKLCRVMAQTGLEPGSHTYKAVLNILETYPRDELLLAQEVELKDIALRIFQMQERGLSRLFVRRDTFGRYFSCMAYVPRERYNTQLRKDTQKLLAVSLNTTQDIEFNTYFSESALARTQYLVRVDNNNFEINVKDIQNNMKELTKTWEDKLERALLTNYGEELGNAIVRQYGSSFSRSYKEAILPNAALVDINKLEELSDEQRLGMIFYRPQEELLDSNSVRLKLFHRDEPLHLSDVLPMLENFGLRVIDESPYEIKSGDGHVYWILDFSMYLASGESLNIANSREHFQTAFKQVWDGELEDDGFNKLVLAGGLTGRQVAIIRAYAKYSRQIGSSFSQTYVENTYFRYPEIAHLLFALFEEKFAPNKTLSDKTVCAVDDLALKIDHALESVANIDDDRIIRRFEEMVLATLRTNFYQVDEQGRDKSYISFKIAPEEISEMPKPLPKYEIFVYSPRVEGVHLRGGKVARGGLRWSDRQEDFRTEVLGLVKAQQVKNTVIVPVGAKGGFVCKQLPTTGGREAFFKEGQACYKTFIRALLDITDNIVQGEVVPPQNVLRHDEDDPYLVVAADKGTATFSDIANDISDQYEFWLGDAFASGGSVGYDHKKMGITARGAWESVKRHFREIGIDCQTSDFTCVAVGDMSGDVFGNGMLLSEHTRLLVAFNHLHIFIDPDPDPGASFKERQRLFDLPRSSWTDYDKNLISKGGGIFERNAKSLKLSSQIQAMLGIKESSMAPNELIRALLKMPVDLFWNGGIGTYIKGRSESHIDVGDRANDVLRVNGAELKARIVGEGGNLGCTQLGRIEYAESGGRINTDFIDNVGGVDCSDNEVNIKILLNALVADGELTVKQRNKLLYDMTEDVSKIVLDDCYQQTHSISINLLKSVDQLKEQLRFIHGLEKQGYLDRELEFLPSDDEIAERQAEGQGLTRPELSVLISYGKMVLKEQLLVPEITENEFIKKELIDYFPKILQKKYAKAMQSHPLKAEIIATKAANRIVNDMGLNFVYRMEEETGAQPAEVVICYTMAREIFDLPNLWQTLQDMDNKIPSIVQNEVLHQLRRMVRRATRWFLRHRSKGLSIENAIAQFRPVYIQLCDSLDQHMVASEVEQIDRSAQALVKEGIDADIAKQISRMSTLFSVMDIAQVAQESNRPIALVAEVYFKLGDFMDLHWFLAQITAQPVTNHWQALARAAYREELDWQQRSLCAVVLRYCSDTCAADSMLETWADEHRQVLERWRHMLADFRSTKSHEFAKFSVALRELMLLSHHCDAL